MILGIDVSFWQKEIDWEKVARAGIKFAFIRISQRGIDNYFKRNWAGAKAAGILRGAYHFCHPHTTYAWQVDHMIKYMDGDYGELPPVCDFEDKTNAIGLDYIKSFLGRLDTKWNQAKLAPFRDSYGNYPMELWRKPILYTGNDAWERMYLAKQSYWALGYPLWISHPIPNMYGVIGIPEVVLSGERYPNYPDPWKKMGVPPAFWQHTYKGDGKFYGVSSLDLDMNIFLGSEKELLYMAGIGEMPEQPAPKVPKTIATRVDMPADFLRFRTRPEFYKGHTLAAGKGVPMELIQPSKVVGIDPIAKDRIEWWYVKFSDYKGYVSASPKYTEIIAWE